MENFLEVVDLKCKGCYRCVSSCPVKAIKIENNKAKIVEDLCISCGNCYRECPHDAIVVRSDLGQVREYIRLNYNVVASLDPFIFSDLSGMNKGQFVKALKQLGFYKVEDMSMASKAVKEFYKGSVNKNGNPPKKKLLMSTYCNCANQMIKKYHEDIVPYLMPSESPMVIHAKYIKEKYGMDTKVIHIGPCISRKVEALEPQNRDYIDKVLTFSQLLSWVYSSIDNISSLEESELDNSVHTEGCVFLDSPCTGSPIGEMTKVDILGIQECDNFMNAVYSGEIENVFANIRTCVGGCAGGPDYKMKRGIVTREQKVREYAKEGRFDGKSKELDSIYSNMQIENPLKKIDVPIKKATEDEIKNALAKMGKVTKEFELDCGACGYKSCREKAIAICKGMSEPKNCRIYMHDMLNRLSNSIFDISPNYIVIVGEDFKIIDVNEAMQNIMGEPKEKLIGAYIGNYMDIRDFVEVSYSKQDILGKKVVWENYGKDLMENILYVEEKNALVAIMNDNTKDESQKRMIQEMKLRTIDISQNLIEKQMRVAQEIASLLGESTAETKIILTSLKELAIKEKEYY